MAEESKYINPNHPVYFSYAGNDGSDPDCDLEKTVKSLRSLFDREHILYFDYKTSTNNFEGGKPYVVSEEEIGNGELIIVVLSDKYINLNYKGRTTLHCMYEWHCIVSRTDYKNHIFTYLAEGDPIKNTFRTPSIEKKLLDRYDKKFDEITDTYLDNGGLDNDLERKYYKAGKDAFKNDLRKMKALVENAPTFDKKTLETVVNKIKDRIAKLYPQPITTEPVDVSNETVASPSRPFDSIVFSYDKPVTTTNETKKFFGRKKYVENLHKLFFENGQNCINVVAKGGMGKTSIAYIYVRDYIKEYKNIQFVVCNDDILSDFNDELRRRICKVDYYAAKCPRLEGITLVETIEEDREKQKLKVCEDINAVLSDADKNSKNLLVIDVNVDKVGLQSIYMPQDVKDKWHILYLSREYINGTLKMPLYNFKDQDNDFEGAKGLFEHIYTRKQFDEKDLDKLFDSIYYHPLLIEQLAAYGMDAEFDEYQNFCDIVAEGSAEITGNFSKYTINYKGKEHDIMRYINKFFNIGRYKDEEQYVIMHFASWEYDFIPFCVIDELLNLERGILRKTLNDLVDKVILLKSNETDSYRIHGLLKEKLKDDIKTYDGYGDYFVKVIDFIKNNVVDEEVEKCIKNIDTVYYPWLNRQPFSVIPHEQTDLKGRTFVIIPVPGYGNIKMMKVPGGEFDMHKSFRVAVDDFYIGETQVTQKLWQTVMGYNLSKFTPLNVDIRKYGGISDTSYFPVDSVSWYDCFVFIMNLNKLTKQKFRLPTEAEWEYAAGWRIDGKRNAYSGCDDVRDLRQYAWFLDSIPHKVATRHPNNLGIYDMSGNVFEWCQDWYGDYPSGSVINPTGPNSGSNRVVRGGSWCNYADICRVSVRLSYAPDYRFDANGFRLLLSSPQKKKKE